MVTLGTVQKKKTMKKESGFKLKSGNKPSPAKMFGGALSMLGRRRTPGGAAGMIGGALGQAMGGRSLGRRASQASRAGVIGALAGAARRNIPGKPASPRGGFMGAIQPIAGRAISSGKRSGGSRRRRRSLFGGLFRRR